MQTTTGDSTLSFQITPQTPQIRFLASLSDGRTVIQDNRPKERHAWIRLRKWLENNPTIKITGLRLQGPNNINTAMPANQKGYFVGNQNQAVIGGGQNTYTGIGYYDGYLINIVWYRQPNFDHSITEERDVKKAGFFLIENTDDDSTSSTR